jgi:O-antigen ligase
MLASSAMAAFHSGGETAIGSLVRVALFGISVYVFFYSAYGPGRASVGCLRPLYWAAAASALFACVDFYFQFPAPAGYAPQFVWLDSGVYRRAEGLFYEASTLGNFCAFFLVMIAVAFTVPRSQSPVSRKALLAGGAVFFAALVLSYSRASLLNLLVASLVLAWRERSRVRLGRVAAILVAAVLLVWRVFPAFAEMYWLRLTNTAEFFFTATEGVLSGRVASWRTLAEWLSANPMQALFGIGYKTLPYTNYLGGPVVADNMYLSLLVETGVAGLAASLWLNVAILRAAARAAASTDRQASFCGKWMLCFWSGQMVQMFSGDLLTYWRVLPVYFFVLALALRV